MRRILVIVLVSGCLVASAISISAQQADTERPKHIRILAAGGLLGQYDGMPEYPGGPHDTEVGPGMHPYGGLQGLVDWVAKDTGPRDLFLMTANNLPREISRADAENVVEFFRQFGQLKPDAVALGVEDFLRGMDGKRGIKQTAPPAPGHRPQPPRARDVPRSGGLLATRMRESPLPFIVTNAAVRLYQTDLNHVADRGYQLSVNPNQSVPWIRDVSMTVPCGAKATLAAGATLVVSRADGHPDRASGQVPLRIGDRGCTASARLQTWLQPASEYTLKVMANGSALASLRLRTDERLTNRTVIAPERPELPLVVALVDPRVHDILARDKWTWRNNDGDAKCAAVTCEIIMLSPSDALDPVLSFEAPSTTTRPILLLSQLDDRDTSTLLQRNQRIRFVVLPPDSGLLGRAGGRTTSGRGGDGPYSGNLGYGAVLNPSMPTVTQIWSRPQWLGEAVHVIEADIAVGDVTEITHAEHSAYSVKGRALCARPAPSGDGVQYFAKSWHLEGTTTVFDDGTEVRAEAAPYRYVPVDPNLPYDADGRFRQGELWTSLDAFAAVALDAMRREFNTDLALLPANAIDDHWFTYLRDNPQAPRQWLSRVLLERLLFRAGTIVKVRLSGTEIYRRLPSIFTGATVCLSGVGQAGCGSRAPSDRTLVNERRVDENRYYTVALPESVALENRLARFTDREEDLVDVLNRVFAKGSGTAADSCAALAAPSTSAAERRAPGEIAANQRGRGEREPSLSQTLEHARASENSPYFYVKPAEFSFSSTQVAEPRDGQGLLGKLSVPNSGAKPSKRSSVTLGVDIGAVDTSRWALRAIGRLAYGNAVVNGQSSTDPNAWLTALRADWKVRDRGRFYGGVYWESQFTDIVTNVTATNKSVTGPTLPLVSQRRDYRYVSAGFELQRPQLTPWLSLDPLGASAAYGVSAHEHVDIAVDGNLLGLKQLQTLGATGLLNSYFATHPGLSASSTYAFVDAALVRARVQVDCTPRFKIPFGAKTLDVIVASSYRRFIGPNMTPLSERQSATMRLTVAIPLYGVATLNLNGTESVSQVNGVDGWFKIWQPSVSVSIPVIASRHGGWVY